MLHYIDESSCTNINSFSRALSEKEVQALYNEGKAWTYDGDYELDRLTKFAIKSPVSLGHTEYVCDQCDLIGCAGDIDMDLRPFYGCICTCCGAYRSIGSERDGRLLAEATCKFGRPIHIQLFVCNDCRDLAEAKTMGYWRPFRDAKDKCL